LVKLNSNGTVNDIAWHHQAMRKVTQAPNLALATLWADMLSGVGVTASVQRVFAGSIAGELPPDQCLPEVWVQDPQDRQRAQALLHEWQHQPFRRWVCTACQELVEGPFEQCWNCSALQS
jgi:hypothetical protein